MRFRSLALAAAVALVASSGVARAAFTITAVPSVQQAPAGKSAYDFFAQNDAGGTDGSNLQAVKIVFTAGAGTKVFFNTADLANGTTPETYSADQYNFGPGTSGTNVTDLGSSNLRIGTRTAGQHAFPNYPGDENSPITQDQATNGLSTWDADYAVLSAAVSVPTPTTPGARFARLVFNNITPTFVMVVTLAGEVGMGVNYTFQFHVDDFNTPPIGTSNPTPVVFGPTVSNGQTFSVNITAVDTDTPAQTLTLALGALPAGISNVAVTPIGGGTSGTVFNVTGTVAYSLNMSSVFIPYTITDNNQGPAGPGVFNGTFQLLITPEPTSMAALAGVAALGIVRRRR
jgi:hypothetical protein